MMSQLVHGGNQIRYGSCPRELFDEKARNYSKYIQTESSNYVSVVKKNKLAWEKE